MDQHAASEPDRDITAALRAILGVIRQSRGDESPVFDAILDSARRLCAAPLAGLSLVHGDGAHYGMVTQIGMRPDFMATDAAQRSPLDSPLAVARAIRPGTPVQVNDLRDDALYRDGDPIRRQTVDVEGVRTLLAVPLVRDGHGIGALVLYRRDVQPFSDGDIALVEAFAEQAVIAIDNARQFRELRTRLEHEAALRDILAVISRSRDDEAPVFEVILEHACRLCDAPFAALYLRRAGDDRIDQAASHGARTEYLAAASRTWRLDGPAAVPRAITAAAPVQIDDLADTEVYRQRLDPQRVEAVDIEGIRTFLAVPLMQDGTAIGAIGLYRREVAPFSADQIALLETFAAQAVIAIENVRQFRELQTRLERESATREILQVISQSREDDMPVFEKIAEQASRLCDAPLVGLALVGDMRDRIRQVGGVGPRMGQYLPGEEFLITPGSADAAVIEGAQTLHFHDVTQEPESFGDEENNARMAQLGIRTRLSVPLLLNGQTIGLINLNRTEVRPFSQSEITLVETFAAQAVIAIENVRQFRTLEKLNAELGDRVADQVGEIERMGRLKRFLSPAVADAVISAGSEDMLQSHRALIATLFADMRGFTAFCETAEPEETIEVLQTFHEEMGQLIHAHGAGVDSRAGDGIMVIMGDPLPLDDPAGDALNLALAMRDRMAELSAGWRRLGHRLGFGVGLSLGYATVGMVGSDGRYDYTASGTAVNLAARLCDHAADGEILLSPRACMAVEDRITAESMGEMEFKGIKAPVEVFRVVSGAQGA